MSARKARASRKTEPEPFSQIIGDGHNHGLDIPMSLLGAVQGWTGECREQRIVTERLVLELQENRAVANQMLVAVREGTAASREAAAANRAVARELEALRIRSAKDHINGDADGHDLTEGDC